MRRARALTLSLTIGLVVGCGRPVPEDDPPPIYDWDRSPSALVVGFGEGPGMCDQGVMFMTRFYGSSFVRLMGDGTLYTGDPVHVQRRQLDEEQMQGLLAAIRPDRLGDAFGEDFSACHDVYDAGTDWLEVHVAGSSGRASIYGRHLASDFCESDAIPAALHRAFDAVAAQRAVSGEPFAPDALYIGASEIGAADPQDTPWPLPEVDLAQAPISYGGEAATVDDPQQVAQLVEVLARDNIWSLPLPRFAQAGKAYDVVYAARLP